MHSHRALVHHHPGQPVLTHFAMRRGFTLVEMVIVVLIVGLALWMSIPAYEGYVSRMRTTETIVAMGEMSKVITEMERTTGALPATLANVTCGAEACSMKRDPWGRPYEYHNLRTATGNGQARKDKKLAPLNSDFDLYSLGADGQTAANLGNAKSRDDIVRARDGAFIGTAEEFDP